MADRHNDSQAGVAGSPWLAGKPYFDGSDVEYLAMLAQPVVVSLVARSRFDRAFRRARARNLSIAVYTDDLFATGNDADNRAAVRAVPTDDLRLAGFSVAGDRRDVDNAPRQAPPAPLNRPVRRHR